MADQESHEGYELAELLSILVRRRMWVIGSVILLLCAAILYSWMQRPVFEATATIELNKSGNSVDLGVEDLLGGQLSGGSDLQIDIQTETAILQGDSLALDVIKKMKLTSDEPSVVKGDSEIALLSLIDQSPQVRTRLLALFRRRLKVVPTRGTRLIKVTYSGYDPEQAAAIANAIIDSYKTLYMQSHYSATSEVSSWLTKQLSELKSNVEESEKKLTDYERGSGLLSLPGITESTGGTGGVHSVVIQKLDMLNTQLTEAEANRISKETIYRLVSKGSEDAIVSLSKDPLALQSKSVVLSDNGGVVNLLQLRQQKNQLKISIAQARSVYGDNNRHLIELQTQLRALEEQMRAEIQEIVRSANGDFLRAKQTEDIIRARFDQQQAEAAKLNEKAVELAVLSQEASSRKKLYEDLYSKLQEANVAAGIKATNITVVDPARAQSVPISPKRLRNYAAGLLAGLVVGLLLAFAVNGLDSSIRSPLEIERISSIPVIGVVPPFVEEHRRSGSPYGGPRAPDKDSGGEAEPEAVWLIRYPESAGAEAIRAIRTSIMLSRPGGGPRVLLVTSCFPGEGKSTISANIATSYAQHGKSVIIVEADMRRPSMKHVLNVNNARGLSGVLSGVNTLNEVLIRNVGLPGLDVLPAGPRPPLPSELLGAEIFVQLIQHLREVYDMVVIDSPPALLLTDAVTVSAQADAAVWVALAGVVKRQQIARATQMIVRNSIPVIGFVVNRMDSSADPYGYGYGYGSKQYGSYYGEENPKDE